MQDAATAQADALRAAEENELWYHSIELAPGHVTRGAFDLRPIAGRLPWPDVRGKRCLDVGTYDGYLAFELERRGASEVVATDISGHEDWDWPPELAARGSEALAEIAGEAKTSGFDIARAALGSSVERRFVSVYDLDPQELGEFDVVTCGSLLLHLRDPLRALEAIRRVCRGEFMSSEAIDLWLSVAHRRRPVARLGPLHQVQWWTVNVAAHRTLLAAAGFTVEREVRFYSIPPGAAHPPPAALRDRASALLQRALTGNAGVPHTAALARAA